ncbi:nitrous oxide reductase family maturation protein NosD [Lutibacter sp. HS1-25]|uniref:nitrous oxide reductase family maturation protein NosD n=1 Tax=Lutibacter sp. HS1-25 TaxID=2485000 RepID=UPI0010117AAB|nr:nitrous oxide reductase family maturation protein NosD [Lutibacter sp. HS1-25]RXP44510.1 nitrous oxide reductase family maturation protein NosD [Lutibacter sp. HS1-25]
MRNYLFLFSLFCITILQAKQIEVCKSCSISTIKKAVEIAEDGDEIFIKKGIYKENDIEINKSLIIFGEEGTILDGTNKGSVLHISVDNFVIRSLKIINVVVSYTKDYAAIKVVRSNNFTIENIVLDEVFFGVLIEKSHNGKVLNNKISSTSKDEANSGNGIHIWHSSNMEVSGNEVYGMRDGVYFEFVTDSKIHNNLSHNNIRYGLHFMFSNNDTYFNNEFVNNGAGVAVMFSKFISMYQNKFTHNWGSASYGLLLKEIYDTQIYNNIFEENTIGIKGEGCTRINYKNNTFIRNGWAIKIAGACYGNIFEQNDFMHNSLDLAYNTQVNDNRFESNYWSEYTGYDLDKNGIGDIPYRPVKLFSYIVNQTPEALVLLRSLFVDIINFSEKVSPVFTPDDLMDKKPIMKRIND